MKNNSEFKCPNCGSQLRQPIYEESCALFVPGPLENESEIPPTCIHFAAVQRFLLDGVGADPCEHCLHRLITEEPGTYVATRQTGERCWEEHHRCCNCAEDIYLSLQ